MIEKTSFRQSIRRQEFLHLTALNAFALVQPILDRLAANRGFLRIYGYSAIAVGIAIAILLTAFPVSVFLGITVLRWRGWKRSATVVLGIATGLMSVMSLLIVGRWLSISLSLLNAGVPDSGIAIIATCGGLASVWLYFRSENYRRILSFSAMGAVLFPITFLGSPTIREDLLGIASSQDHSPVVAKNPAPVVMIVFDGLCGMALLNEKHEIDRVRYPAFGRLSDISSWYRNATTVHSRTDHALPAILASCIPEEKQTPFEADYPLNLFRLVHSTDQYDMTVFEPYTHLYPEEVLRNTLKRSFSVQLGQLLNILLRVHARITIPQDIELLDVSIPREWFGMIPPSQLDRNSRTGRISYAWDVDRDIQCEHFLDCLNVASKPGFRFLHVVMPHDPWSLLPSGKSYFQVSQYVDDVFGSRNETWSNDELPVHLAWQRYLLQLQYADIVLGRVLDRLEAIGQLDDALIVVTADHGMAFVCGQSRRMPAAETIPDIVSVPLFFKQPGQRIAEVSDKNVESIDILPTITDVLGLPADGAWDGTSILSHGPERPRKTIQGINTVLNPDFPQRFDYVDRMIQVFGSGLENDRLWNLHTIPELTGTEVSKLVIGSQATYRCWLFSGGVKLASDFPRFVPCYFRGQLQGAARLETPRQLALSLNGVIVATTRTGTDSEFANDWSVLLPDSVIRPEGNQLQLFEVETGVQTHILHEIPLEIIRS